MAWMRLSAYCAQQNESPDAISKRVRAGHWLAGVHVRKPPEQIAHQVSIRLTPARKVKYLALGGNAWLNKAIDRAKVKGDQ